MRLLKMLSRFSQLRQFFLRQLASSLRRGVAGGCEASNFFSSGCNSAPRVAALAAASGAGPVLPGCAAAARGGIVRADDALPTQTRSASPPPPSAHMATQVSLRIVAVRRMYGGSCSLVSRVWGGGGGGLFFVNFWWGPPPPRSLREEVSWRLFASFPSADNVGHLVPPPHP